MRKKILLVGGGYAHLFFLKRYKETTIEDVDVTVLSDDFSYLCPDLIPEWIGGLFLSEEIMIDVKKLADEAGAVFVKGEALSVDRKQKMVLTSEGEILSFDVVSFDHRQRHTIPLSESKSEHVVVPSHLHPKSLQKLSFSGDIVIFGGGLIGVETSFAILNRKRGEGTVAWIESDTHVRSEVKEFMVKSGIRVIPNGRSMEWTSSTLKIESSTYPFDSLWYMDGSGPRGVYESSKLPVDERGYLMIESTLQSKEFPFIFGAGYEAVISSDRGLKVNRSTWVKQGDVLFDNINGYLKDGDGYHYHPPRGNRLMVSIGDKKAILFIGPVQFKGKLPGRIKERMNRNFMSLFK